MNESNFILNNPDVARGTNTVLITNNICVVWDGSTLGKHYVEDGSTITGFRPLKNETFLCLQFLCDEGRPMKPMPSKITKVTDIPGMEKPTKEKKFYQFNGNRPNKK